RRLVDEPDGVAQADREHVAGCPVCLAGLAAAQQDAALTGAALSVELTPDVDAGWTRLSGAVTAAADKAPNSVQYLGLARRWRIALRSPVVAVVGVVALLAGAGAAAATNWLPIFRAEQIAPVTAPLADLGKLPDLSAFGELEVTAEVKIRQVADAAAAEQASGLSVPRVGALPKGVTGEPRYSVGGRATAVFTYSAAKAAQSAAAAGQTLTPPPAGLDGSQFRLTAGPGVAAVWSQDRPAPALIVGRAVAPTAYSSGVAFETARDYLLSLPILPAGVASQLRSFSADGTTLPLFMATEELTSHPADVHGARATVFASRDEVLAGVVWVDDGVVTGVAGSLSDDEVLAVARGLRWDR
ncbi:MAG TPA: hypothetical protein VGB74_09975, partial [Actinoplanes sp.]